MRRVTCHQLGDPDELVIEEVATPSPGPGQVAIEVRGAGVNFVDALVVRGGYQIKPPTPFTPGGEVAGVVTKVGSDVVGIKRGDRVLASCGLGGFAEVVIANTGAVYALPNDVSFLHGASLMQSYATAVFALTQRTTLVQEEWVLVLGAGGGVGRACVDLARSLGAHVIGVGSTEAKRQAAIDAGAEAVIDGTDDVKVRAREVSGGGVDIVVDPVGGDIAEPALRALKTFGRYLVIGFVAGIPRVPLNQVLLNNRTVIGVDWGAWAMRNADANRAIVEQVLDMVATGTLRPAMPAVAKLDEVSHVLRDLEERRVTGKVVLIP